jgi:hypothetical protein
VSKPRSAQLVVLSDLHCGSKLGILPPKFELDDGNVIGQNMLQAEMWKFWTGDLWKYIDQRAKTRETIVVCNGDLIDSLHHQTFQVVSNDPLEHIVIATSILTPIAAKYKTYVIRGTPAHVMASGSADEQVAQEIGAEKVAGDRKVRSSFHLKLNFAGALFDFAHQGPNPGTRMWLFGNSLRGYARTIVLDALVRHDRPPDCVVRSHFHRKCLETINDYNHECKAIVTPALQFKTEYSHMIVSHESIADVGATVISIDDGRISDVEFRVLSLSQTDTVTI